MVDPAPKPPGFYRDAQGALKRQAACFHIYGLNAQGQAVAELTAHNAEIVWSETVQRVHESYRHELIHWYGVETRWSHSPFWKRRQSIPA